MLLRFHSLGQVEVAIQWLNRLVRGAAIAGVDILRKSDGISSGPLDFFSSIVGRRRVTYSQLIYSKEKFRSTLRFLIIVILSRSKKWSSSRFNTDSLITGVENIHWTLMQDSLSIFHPQLDELGYRNLICDSVIVVLTFSKKSPGFWLEVDAFRQNSLIPLLFNFVTGFRCSLYLFQLISEVTRRNFLYKRFRTLICLRICVLIHGSCLLRSFIWIIGACFLRTWL